MNYKTMLLATAAVFASTQAMAADITGAFAVPGEGQFLSDTSLGYERAKAKHHWGVGEQTYVAETLEYGLTDAVSVNATIANMFDTQGEYNNDHNWGYALGAKYNTNFDKTLFQVAVSYETYNPKDFGGHHVDKRWQKYVGTDVKLGYDMGDGLTPYATYHFGSDIDNAQRDIDQSVSLGVHKFYGQYALDVAVRYDFETEGKNTNDWWLDAEADYYLKDNVVLGAYGSYYIDGTGSKNVDYAYEAGVHVKVLF